MTSTLMTGCTGRSPAGSTEVIWAAACLAFGVVFMGPLADAAEAAEAAKDRVSLNPKQAEALQVAPVGLHRFEQRRQAVGIIDFDQDALTPVFPPYAGRIGKLPVKAGDAVHRGQLLYTVDIPDLAQAASTLIAASANLKVANETLARAQDLARTESVARKDLAQNIADQQTAQGAWQAARKTLRLFGLSEREVDEIESQHQVSTEMPVRSPLAGRVVNRSASPGLLVQPGMNTAPLTVGDTSRVWLVAQVPEAELAAYRLGQALQATVPAYPDKVFAGTVNYLGDAVDPNTHRIVVRASLRDPAHLLRPQMMASFSITLGPGFEALAVPARGLVREGDGQFTAWVTDDGATFRKRTVQTGRTQQDWVEITAGLKAGEKIAQERALFLSNLLVSAPN